MDQVTFDDQERRKSNWVLWPIFARLKDQTIANRIMSDGYVKSATVDGVATVTFHHPKSNSLPGHILRGMAAAIEEAGQDSAVRVIVLRSDGDRVFCAGASFDELVAIKNAEQGLEFFSGFALVINAIRKAPVLVIGRIHAHTVGGGVGLASAVDIAYAHDKASARLSELASRHWTVRCRASCRAQDGFRHLRPVIGHPCPSARGGSVSTTGPLRRALPDR